MSMDPEAIKKMARRGGRAPKHVMKFTISDLLDATGRSHESVRKDRMRGKLDTKDLLSLSQYVVKHASSLKQGS
jgi:hypothetical protein